MSRQKDRRSTTRLAEAAGLVSRPLFLTSLITSLAAASLTGCSSSNNHAWNSKSNNTQASREASAIINPNATSGQFTNDYYNAKAQQNGVPARYVSEAQVYTASTQARRAAAQSAFVQAHADQVEALAAAEADFQSAVSAQTAGTANAIKLRQTFASKLNELASQADAREELGLADSTRRAELLRASQMQWQGEFEAMRTDAETQWGKARAMHNAMLADRANFYDRSLAEIDEMIKVADLTESRATAKFAELRAAARTATEQAQAEAATIGQMIQTVSKQSTAEAAELRQRAKSLEQSSTAAVAELRAKTRALSEQDIDRVYTLDTGAAQTHLTSAQAEHQRMINESVAMRQNTSAAVSRKRAEAAKSLDTSRAEFEGEKVAIDRFREQGEAQVALRMAEANRIEADARAEFVKAEASARAAAAREAAIHQVTLADAEFKRIRAEAEAEATRIRAEFLKDFANQARAGKVAVKPMANSGANVNRNDAVPQFTKVQDRPEVIQPDHIASFKSSLAEAAMIRQQASASNGALLAGVEERNSKLQAWWMQQTARYDAAIAEADALQRWGDADVADQIAKAESFFAGAKAENVRAIAEADARRQEVIAKITSLAARADKIQMESESKVAQLLVQANTVELNGKSEVQRLTVQQASILKRGDAESKQLLAEADALQTSQKAVVAQMRQDIESSQLILRAEVAKLDQAAESFLAIARATYDESITAADTFARIADANVTHIDAQNLYAQRLASAEVDYMRGLAVSNKHIANAAVARVSAESDFILAQAKANNIAVQSGIRTNNEIATTAAGAEFIIADAEDLSTNSLFNARIASTIAERDRTFAENYLNQYQQNARAEQAVAAARAYRDLSNQAMAQLNQRRAAFDTNAQQNWNFALAQPSHFATPDNAATLGAKAEQTFILPPTTGSTYNNPVITSVDVNRN